MKEEISKGEVYPSIFSEMPWKFPGEAPKAGADTLEVACPACKHQISRVVEGEGRLEVYSIAELVAQSP